MEEQLMKELKKRNLTLDHIMEYIKFEDECIEKGFTFNSLIEAREKQIPKKPNIHGYREGREINTISFTCPICNKHINMADYCEHCGQAIDWGE